MRRHGFVLLSLASAAWVVGAQSPPLAQPDLGSRGVTILEVRGQRFKDLNKNGRLDPYEDWRRPVDDRVTNLLSFMTLDEKAGLMVGPTLPMGPDGAISEGRDAAPNPFGGSSGGVGTSDAVLGRHIRQFINRVNTHPRTMATWLNPCRSLRSARASASRRYS